MAAAYDSGSNFQGNTASPSVAHTGGAGTNRLLVVTTTLRGNGTVTAITYNGVAMTLVDSQQHGTVLNTSMFYLIAPDTGANTLALTTTAGAVNYGIRAHNLSGMDQAAPLRGSQKFNSSSSNPTNMAALTTQSGDLVLDGIGTRTTTATSLIAGGSQVQQSQFTQGSLISCSSSILAGGSSQSMTWTLDVADNWCQVGAAFIAAGGGGGGGGTGKILLLGVG